jgi:hypothetical protein
MRRLLCLSVLLVSGVAGTAPYAAASGVLPDRTLPLGSTYTIRGQTGAKSRSSRHIPGTVTLLGSWDNGPWHLITETMAKGPAGLYRLVVRPTHRGVLRLRIETPDAASYTVQLTIT